MRENETLAEVALSGPRAAREAHREQVHLLALWDELSSRVDARDGEAWVYPKGYKGKRQEPMLPRNRKREMV